MITIKPLNITNSDRLAQIIGTDEKLHNELSSSKPMLKSSAAEYFGSCKQWMDRTNSINYAILLDDAPIGQISISHRDYENKTARCGYWIESKHWGKGFTTKAFELALSEAYKMNLKSLTCSILKDNLASIALWKRQGAKLMENENRVIPVLSL